MKKNPCKTSKRMFIKGDRIKSLDELIKQEYIIWAIDDHKEKTTHIGFISSMQLHRVNIAIQCGEFYKAIRNTEVKL